MTLDIVCTHYHEQWKLGRPFFEMLALQRGVDFDDICVYLVQDGPVGKLPIELFDEYPYRVIPVDIPHSGISAARNAGFDAGAGDWVMFCDFDDSFLTVTALFKFFERMDNDEYKIIISQFDEEVFNSGKLLGYLNHDGKDFIWIHGKMFRRSWLIEENIRFDPELIYHEDTYVMMLSSMILSAKQVCFIPESLYIWQFNPESTVRAMDDYVYQTYDHYIKKSAALVKELDRRGLKLHAALVVCQVICDTYINLCKISWQNLDNRWIEKSIHDFIQMFPELIEMAHEPDYVECLDAARFKVLEKNDLGIERPAFPEWFEKVRSGDFDIDVSGGDQLVPGGADAAGGGGAGVAETPE